MTQPYLSVVIPAYNEAFRIRATLEQLHAYLSQQDYLWEILVADDGSADATAQLVAAFAADHPGVSASFPWSTGARAGPSSRECWPPEANTASSATPTCPCRWSRLAAFSRRPLWGWT